MSKPILISIDGQPISLSGLRIDRQYELTKRPGGPLPVEIVSVTGRIATVTDVTGNRFDCLVEDLREREEVRR